MLIKDILTIDLSEDIKNVIDLEDITESAIQSEIEGYIITEGLAKEYSNFVSVFTSNIIETGVWLSGFYGSGKSYFGKLLGYMMSKRIINGTPAIDRILQRFIGIEDAALIHNSISRLKSINSRVVFMDIAKQDTAKGLAYTLFRNFLKSLELPENEHGFLLFTLMCDAKYSDVKEFVQKTTGNSWSELRNNRSIYIGKVKELFLKSGKSEADYHDFLTTIRREIDEFSASKLKEELANYFAVQKDEKIVFLFDEASEAINQKKFTLLDLEGLSESLSSLGGKVWTIAIAQEKLDDVINNTNVTKAQLTKVTDRFKTKIHLESTEVDVIIRSRLLKKKGDAESKLKEYYQLNSGKIADHSGLIGASKTESLDSFVTYYPFYQNQFGLLQNFLFGRQGYASTKVAARGMIITTYDILKRELQNEHLFNVATGWQIAQEAQPQPPARMVNRFSNATTILKNEKIDIHGRQLLETINFLYEAEITPTTLGNIVRSYIKVPEDYHSTQTLVSKALDTLVDHKILLLTDGKYRITSDDEQRLLDEMSSFSVQTFKKKQSVINAYKSTSFFKGVSKISDSSSAYDFYVTSDNDDEITNPTLKYLKIRVKNIYSIGDNRTSELEQIKSQYQNVQDVVWLVPDNSNFKEIDKLLDEIERIKFIEEKYANPLSKEAQIVRSFQAVRSNKENRFKELVEQSLMECTTIYLYNTAQLDSANWQATINGVQRQVIQNVYSQRLSSQLSDGIAEKIIKEGNSERLHTYFTSQGADFQFFDAHGNFVGESLKPTEKILDIIKNTFIDGSTLEKELEKPPYGFSFGTVITTVAALMRGGKILAKDNGAEKFSWRDEGVAVMFTARVFRKATFKAIVKALTSAQKNTIVTELQGLECQTHTGRQVNWNTNDFDLVSAVRELAKRFCDKVDDMKRLNKDFDMFFSNIEVSKEHLTTFTGAVSEANYIDKAEYYLSNKETYSAAIQEINKVEKFIRNNLPKIREWKSFADAVTGELTKASISHPGITTLVATFHSYYKGEVVKNFSVLQETIQKIKDGYFVLLSSAANDMAEKYTQLSNDAAELLQEIGKLPEGLNDEAEDDANQLLKYASQRITTTVEIDYSVQDKKSGFTYSEMLSSIQLFNSQKTKLDIITAGLIKTVPPPTGGGSQPPPPRKTYLSTLPGSSVKVGEYKAWLQKELQKISGANPDDIVEIN